MEQKVTQSRKQKRAGAGDVRTGGKFRTERWASDPLASPVSSLDSSDDDSAPRPRLQSFPPSPPLSSAASPAHLFLHRLDQRRLPVLMFWFHCSRRFLLTGRDLVHKNTKFWPSSCRTCAGSSSGAKSASPGSGVADEMGQLVYEGSLTRTVRGVKLFSLSTSCLGLAIQSLVYVKMSESQSTGWVFLFAGSIATIVLMSPLLLHYVAKRYVTHLYYEPNSRTFTTWSLTLLNRKRETRFKAEDVVVPTVRGPFTTFTVARRPFFIDPLSFKDVAIFEHLVGYDKLDARLRAVGGDQNHNRGPADAAASERESTSGTRTKSE